MTTLAEETVWNWLQDVKDPEIPTVSIVDMGMVNRVLVGEKRSVEVELIPTFVGCPALEIIRQEVKKVLRQKETRIGEIIVRFVFDPPWSSERITEEGRENLKRMGIAPPPKHVQSSSSWIVDCPYCGSPKTVMENVFGPTACRSILYCTSCKNPFEAIKPL